MYVEAIAIVSKCKARAKLSWYAAATTGAVTHAANNTPQVQTTPDGTFVTVMTRDAQGAPKKGDTINASAPEQSPDLTDGHESAP